MSPVANMVTHTGMPITEIIIEKKYVSLSWNKTVKKDL